MPVLVAWHWTHSHRCCVAHVISLVGWLKLVKVFFFIFIVGTIERWGGGGSRKVGFA